MEYAGIIPKPSPHHPSSWENHLLCNRSLGAKKSGDPWSRCKMVVACDEGSHGAEGKEQI